MRHAARMKTGLATMGFCETTQWAYQMSELALLVLA
jgi:hypothetical protein